MTTIEKDFIPQHPDKGCELHKSCLECPEPECREDISDRTSKIAKLEV